MITLLIVEDEAAARSILTEFVSWKEMGIEKVYSTGDGLSALDLAKEVHPDIILSDIRMPKMNGLEFAGQYRKVNFDCQFIFLSAYPEKDYFRAAMRLRAVNFVEKPIRIRQIEEAVQNALAEIRREEGKIKQALERSMNREESGELPPPELPPSAKLLTSKTQSIIQKSYSDENLSIELIAARLRISSGYLSSIFKKNTGMTINHYLTQIRIESSRKLLKNSRLSLSDICKKSGYRDYNYFSRVFKENTGMTPSEYRRYENDTEEYPE
ncbi:response regulator transcription factor [Lachnoclostridium sp. Marseille-P6806]|uniref:response regulator transcription factor n=1 Tax=Lachnoclostridium sp. Marseille-P6806 TaxID=2364793 RepID=UPI001031E094|nr:helix-turn-helix domain-containing protein [Lachnoclostridium sp. Marseille-P6806]